MQLIVNIKDENLARKIIKLLNIFQDEGIEIIKKEESQKEWSDEYVQEHWREIGMNTHSADIDDDEYLYEAAWEYFSEKHSD